MDDGRRYRSPLAVVWIVGPALLALAAPLAAAQTAATFAEERNRMVDEEIVRAGVTNPRVIEAMRNTPRHEFVQFRDRRMAYFDMALPIGEGQTISPPFIVAYMTEQIDPQPTDRVLEIGTGSGYQAAVLSPLVAEVYTIEIVDALGRNAARTLKRLKYDNVYVKVGDGYLGWPEHAPFDKIIVTCSPEKVPQPLVDQLKEGGRIVIPLGERFQQMFYLLKKEKGELVSEALKPTLFVPMTGAAEQRRQVKPDPLNPTLHNGGFEETLDEGQRRLPLNWHYARQVEIVDDPLAPEGRRYARFSNETPGRGSQALQGFAISGRDIDALEVSCVIKGSDIRPGQAHDQLPLVAITFYDARQDMVGHRAMGPWRGTFAWQRETDRVPVPSRAVTAILRVGLLGGVGEFSIDDIQIKRAGK